MKYLKYILFIMIIFLNFNVFASDYNVSSKIKATTSGSTGRYYGLEIYNSGTNNVYSINTRYTGRLSKIEFYVNADDFNWDYNKTYTITLNMATEDWRNNFMGPSVYRANTDGSIPSSASNMYVSNSFQFISMKKIKFNFKIPSVMGPYIKFTIYSGNVSSTAITGVSNWNLSSVIISDISSSSTTPTPAPVVTATPTPTPSSGATNNDVINANNQNTQNIINNQNSNTQSIINSQNNNSQNIIDNQTSNTSDIIENANSNTEQIVESINDSASCPNGPLIMAGEEWYSITGKYLDSNGAEISNSSGNISPFIQIKPNTHYVYRSNLAYTAPSLCFYSGKSTQTLISCISYNSRTSFDITTPNNARFMLVSFYGARHVVEITGPVCNDWEKESQDKTTNAINEVNDSINNSSIDDKTSFFTSFNNNTHGLTGIITLPLSTIQSLTNSTCVALSIPIPFTNSNVSLPCMTQVYSTYIPSVYSIWQVVSFGIISYLICLDIFKMVKGFKDPNDDKIEVLDL